MTETDLEAGFTILDARRAREAKEKTERNKMEEHYKLEEARCCGNCKHSHYSTATLSSWCNKHPEMKSDDYSDTNICKDFEEEI